MSMVIIIAIFLLSLSYRIYGLWHNHPFWVDEFSTAETAKIIAERGIGFFGDKDVFLEAHNVTTYIIVALSFKLLGISEFAARLPFAIIGSFVPVLVYLLAKKTVGRNAAVAATILTMTAYFEIVWSRQARGYVLIQVLILSALYLYHNLLYEKRTPVIYGLFVAVAIIGTFTHFFFYIFLLCLIAHAVVVHRGMFKDRRILLAGGLIAVALLAYVGPHAIQYYKTLPALSNNLWYYHAFLWREYGLVTFLGLMGLLIALRKNPKFWSFVLFYIMIHLSFVTFFFPPYVSRYLLPIFPFLYIGMGSSISKLAELLIGKLKAPTSTSLIGAAAIAVFIVINGHKFDLKPNQFYSVNHDFREIALVDYHNVYGIIKKKGDLQEGKTAVIDTWNARTWWYVGSDYKPVYMYRWIQPVTINGLINKTDYYVNKEGEKVIPRIELRLIGELKDLKLAMKKYPKGFIYIDDTSMPADVREYAEKNFKKEITVDRYSLDDNPYSVWPATLYSWGVK